MNGVHWIQDTTGRFLKRPHYAPEYLDGECERIVSEFLLSRHGRVHFPIGTEDLKVLLDESVEDLDCYADFSSEEGEVEGLTEFRPGKKPIVKIAASLTEAPHMENRLRTTLTHEYGHVRFHSFLYQVESKPASLFEPLPLAEGGAPKAQCCKRDAMASLSRVDWMEWQAGYVCGAMLMPRVRLVICVQDFRRQHGMEHAAISEHGPSGAKLVDAIASAFQTSKEAARVRLLQTKLIHPGQGTSLI